MDHRERERLSSWRVSKRGGNVETFRNVAKVDRSSPRYIIELFSRGRFDSTPGIRDENSTRWPIPSFIDRLERLQSIHETWEYLNFQLLHSSTSVCTVTFFIATTCSFLSYRDRERREWIYVTCMRWRKGDFGILISNCLIGENGIFRDENRTILKIHSQTGTERISSLSTFLQIPP